jgi:O-antigen/teichoic acid export membrane protein
MTPSLARLKLGPIARGSIFSLTAKIFALLMGFSAAVLAARLLGPGGYGEFAVALSGATIAAVLGGLGINNLAVREIARLQAAEDWRGVRAFAHRSLVATLAASALAAGLLALISFRGGLFGQELLWAAPTVVLLALLQAIRGLVNGAGQVAAAQLPLDIVRWMLIVSGFLALLLGGGLATPQLLLLVWIVALLAALLVAGAALVRVMPGPAAAGGQAGQRWLGEALPFLGIAVLGIAGSEAATILLGWLAGPEQAGLFQPIARITPIMLLAADAIAMPLWPRLTTSWHRADRPDLLVVIRKAALAATVSTAALLAMILLLLPFILAAFGPEFAGQGEYLWWIAGAQLVNAFVGPAPLLLSIAGEMRHRLAVQLVTFAVQIGTSILLIPRLGVGGAALALAAGIVTWAVLHWLVAWRTTGIDTSVFGWLRAAKANSDRQ